ncbi:ABC transporter permease [Streptacidiphilus monticola]|uniref:ABC transporter permease n=1 Tax=Streptacidiphilus monticola TaxID=2161674 RepID=A0ABW1FYA3_9ACTN
MRSSTAVGLVAGRELRVRMRSKAFAITLAIAAVLFAGFPVVMHFVQHHGPSTEKVALTQADAAVGGQLDALATALGQNLEVRTVADAAAGVAAVKAGDVAAFAQPSASGTRVTVDKSLSAQLRALFQTYDRQAALDAQIRKLGGDPAQVSSAVAAAQVTVTTLRPADPLRSQRLAIAIAAGLLMYMSLMTVGQIVAQGVVEEKSSRVVELLLSTLKPWQLLAGKVIGTGTLGLVQILVPGALGVGVGIATGTISISLSGSVGSLLWALVWYLAGFIVYALLFAAVGATVSRQEDLGGAMAPIILPLVAAWVIGISVVPGDPGNGLVGVLSYIPLFAPVLMPMRYAMGTAELWQVLVALALTLALGVVLLRFAGRVYRNSVLRSGARVPLREALKAA